MNALYVTLAFSAVTAIVAIGAWLRGFVRDISARTDILPNRAFQPIDFERRRGGRRQFTGRGAYDEECLEPGGGYMPPGTEVFNADGSKVNDRAVIRDLMAGPVASWGNQPAMIPTGDPKRIYVGPNSVTERSADGRVVPFAKPVKRAFTPPKSRSDAHAPNPGFGLGTTARSTPAYNSPYTSNPRTTAPRKEPAKPKRVVVIPEYMHLAADNGPLPSIRRHVRGFAAYGKLKVVPKQ